MALRKIVGLTEDKILNASVEPSTPGLRPFPCTSETYTRYSAAVLKVEIKEINKKDQLAITVCNGAFGGEILICLDPSDVAFGLTPEKQEAQKTRNLETIASVLKTLGCHTDGQLDDSKFGSCCNVLLEIGAKHKGFREYQGTYYHKVSLVYAGAAKGEMLPVDETAIQMPSLPNITPAPKGDPFAASTPVAEDPFGESMF
jgi:hypothetical protein